MNRTETVNLLALACEGQPSLHLTDRTADVWFEALRLVTYADARTGLVEALRRGPVTVTSVFEHAQKARAARLEKAFARGGAPDADPDDPRAYIAALRDGRVQERPAPVHAPTELHPTASGTEAWPPPPVESLAQMAQRLGVEARTRTASQRAQAVREALRAAQRERAERDRQAAGVSA